MRLPGGHYEAFMDGHERALAVQLSFLRRHLIQATSLREAKSAEMLSTRVSAQNQVSPEARGPEPLGMRGRQ